VPGDTYPYFRAAAVHAAPVFLDRDATLGRVEDWVRRARHAGADLVVFGESFVPGFPLWNFLYAPVDQHEFFRRLFDNAVEVPGPHVERLCEIARAHGVVLSVGITEKGRVSMGAMWNSNLLIDATGQIVNHRRKLVPTWAEKLTWANGDAAELVPADTSYGRLGVLICGENTNPLARFALLAQGEQVHIATYPPAWPFRRPGSSQNYDLKEAIRIRSAAHSFEGKVFSVVAGTALDGTTVQVVARGNRKIRALLEATPPSASMILGPQGELLSEVASDSERLVTADIDIALSIEHKQAHDVVGYYNRFDIFRLTVDRRPNDPIQVLGVERSAVDGRSDVMAEPGTG